MKKTQTYPTSWTVIKCLHETYAATWMVAKYVPQNVRNYSSWIVAKYVAQNVPNSIIKYLDEGQMLGSKRAQLLIS